MEKLLEAVFSMWSMERLYRKAVWTSPVTLPMDCYHDVEGGLVPLRFEEGRPKAVREKVAAKGQQQYY
jgi:hypothetical protein